MTDLYRYYNHGLDVAVHLDEIERQATAIRTQPARSNRNGSPLKRKIAGILAATARRLDPASGHIGRGAHGTS